MKLINPKEFKVMALRDCPVPNEMQVCDTPQQAIAQAIEPPRLVESSSIRILKIEESGDFWEGLTNPKIRLMGRWLERAGFRPGNHVHVTCVAPGVIELRSPDTSMIKETKEP